MKKYIIWLVVVLLCLAAGIWMMKYVKAYHLPASEEHIERCFELLEKGRTAIEAGEGPVPERYEIGSEGYGIALIPTDKPLKKQQEKKDTTGCLVFLTQDNGKTWEMNEELLEIQKGITGVYFHGKKLVILSYSDASEQSICYVSPDAGKSFKTKNIEDILHFDCEVPHNAIRPYVEEFSQEDGTIKIKWFLRRMGREYYSFPSARTSLMTAVYNMDMNQLYILSCDEQRIGYAYASALIKYVINEDGRCNKSVLQEQDIQWLRERGNEYIAGKNLIRLLVNDIYASRGYDFADTNLDEYFTYYSAPHYAVKVKEVHLSDIEQLNIEKLVKLREELE